MSDSPSTPRNTLASRGGGLAIRFALAGLPPWLMPLPPPEMGLARWTVGAAIVVAAFELLVWRIEALVIRARGLRATVFGANPPLAAVHHLERRSGVDRRR